ncbi:hypothetical protein ACHQM5_002322 [Ranunculus cassubicifolius]
MALEENTAVEGGGGGGEEEEEESEYESDPEETALSLSMRRRVASDDSEEENEEIGTTRLRVDPRVEIGSDGELDGQGGVDDDENFEEEEVQEVEEEYEEREGETDSHPKPSDEREIQVAVEAGEEFGEEEQRSNVEETGGVEGNEGEEGEKKENEPFAVPTAGAFYMHDDRFRENVGGRNNRRTLGGRKLWESKDDRKWGHDKFEELSVQERQYDKEGRNSRGPYRGRGKNRGTERRQARGNRPRAYEGRNQAHNQAPNQAVRSVRGRGPRRYEPTNNDARETHTQHKQTGRFQESTSNTSSGRQTTNARTSNAQSDSAPPRNNVFASSLSSASPPFYPSGTSNQNITQTQRRELPGGNVNKNSRPSVTSENRNSNLHSTQFQRGKNVVDSVDKHYYDEVPQTLYGKFNNMQLQSSGPLPTITTQYPQNKSKGRGLANSEQTSYQSSPSFSQTSKVSQQTQSPAFHQRPVQNAAQPSFRVSSQQLGNHSSNVSRASSPPKASPTSSSEHGDVESPPGSSKSKAVVAKGKSSIQGNGRGTFLYNGAQVMGASGAIGVSHSDQNFPATPALLQVMQFGGQHPGGLGVPAVGMALPGYVAQPQLGGGFGNSEMTWVPVLAGAAGALGASYPYLVDGAYYSRPSGQSSSSGVTSKESSTSKPNNALKAPQRSELVTDEFGQLQNKPRRYSEMNFGQ